MLRKLFYVAVAVGLLAIVFGFGYLRLFCSPIDSGRLKAIPYHAVIAHRGASYLAPEETMPAFMLARDLGADYLELDVQRTKDHVLVALHDDTLERTTNVAQLFPVRAKDNIETFTLSEVKQLDAGSWFNAKYPERARPAFAGVKILTIEEIIVLAESGERKPSLCIEMKSPAHHSGYEDELVDLLKRKGWLTVFPKSGISKVFFQSFSKASLLRLKELAPDVPRVYLIDKDMADKEGWTKLVAEARDMATGIGPVGNIAWPWNVRKAHAAGLVVYPYTVDAPWQFRVLGAFGVDSFYTNRCDLLMTYYGKPLQAAPGDILRKCGY
ncbi:MAG TPA: glycerophosphodiester phosphodiesterase family protein [Candidatus Hydrogenedentes bacterium]|nr:glycerophosphodiester phosphodiesterase family protein [Candidatus Hydrogenedentota bacterium]